jgi:hypothetical protein
MFFLILVEKKELEQLEKFNALKASKPEVAAEIVDHMEFEAALKKKLYLRFFLRTYRKFANYEPVTDCFI